MAGTYGSTGKITKIKLTQGGAGTLTILAAVTGRTLRLVSLCGSLSANGTLKIQSTESATDLSGAMTLNGGVPCPYNVPTDEGYVSSVAGEGLQLISTGGAFNGSAIVQAILP